MEDGKDGEAVGEESGEPMCGNLKPQKSHPLLFYKIQQEADNAGRASNLQDSGWDFSNVRGFHRRTRAVSQFSCKYSVPSNFV